MQEEFLSYFEGAEIYATVPDDPKEEKKFWHYHGSFQEIKPKLESDQKKKRGVFFAVNELDRSLDPEKRRTKKMFVRARAIWVEDDNVRDDVRKDWPIKPNIVVNSSPGKYHYYWLTSTDSREEWDNVMKRMVQDYGCDNQAKDLTRVLRIPGFYHLKNDPHLVTFEVLRKRPYSWDAIKTAFPPIKEKMKVKGGGGVVDGMSISEINEESKKGHLHGPSRSVAMKLANYGVPEDEALAILMAMYPEHHDGHHQQSIETAYAKVQSEKDIPDEIPEIPEILEKSSMIFPPGLMGKMAKEIYEMSYHPNEIVSIVSAIGFIAGIVGRKFNVSGTGLNLYITLLMETGMGKDMIQKIINRTLTKIAAGAGPTFIGASRWTGPKALWNDLRNGMSKVAVLTEAGLMNGSLAGDRSGLQRTLLNLYTNSGKFDLVASEKYSGKDESLPTLYAPALTIISESTPKVFVENMIKQGGDVNGDLARMWFTRVRTEKSYLNKERRTDFSQDIKNRILELIEEAYPLQEEKMNTDLVTDMTIPPKIVEYSDTFVDIENEAFKSGERFRGVMASRAWLKSVKIAAVIDVFNGSTNEVTIPTYNWVLKNVIDPELKNIEVAFDEEDTTDIIRVIKMHVAPKIFGLVQGKYESSKQMAIGKKMMKSKCFPKTALIKACSNTRQVKELSTKSGNSVAKTGLDIVLDYMVSHGYLEKIPDDKIFGVGGGARTKNVFRITNELVLLVEL